jgi:hypothetical protein
MKPDGVNNHARQFRRHETRYAVRLEPHPDHAEQFRLAFPDAQLDLAVVDVSKGGVGLVGGLFMPRNLRVTLHVGGVSLGPGSKSRDLTIRAIVRRCTLLDHKPTYQTGLQFLEPAGRDERLLTDHATRAMEAAAELTAAGGADGR